jgi:hypothetical protein
LATQRRRASKSGKTAQNLHFFGDFLFKFKESATLIFLEKNYFSHLNETSPKKNAACESNINLNINVNHVNDFP